MDSQKVLTRRGPPQTAYRVPYSVSTPSSVPSSEAGEAAVGGWAGEDASGDVLNGDVVVAVSGLTPVVDLDDVGMVELPHETLECGV